MHFMSALLGVYRAEIGLVILALMFVEFVRERYSPTVVSVLGACAYAALGLLDEKGLFSVFSNSAPLTIGAMFVLAGALIRTGTINRAADFVMKRAEKHPRLAIVEVMLGATVASAFLNNTPVVVVLIPIIFKLSQVTGVPLKKLMMPLSIVAVLGGCITLIGTSTNLIVAGIAADQGMTPFGIFDIAPFGIAGTVAGLAALVGLSFLLPSDPPAISGQDGGNAQDYLPELVVPHDSDYIGKDIGSLTVFGRSAALLGLKRAGEIRRGDLSQEELHAGDRLIVRADGTAIMTLRESGHFELGIAADSETSGREGTVIEAMVELMLQVTGYVMRVAPLAVFGALASSITVQGLGVLQTYGELVGEFYIAIFCLWGLLFLAGSLFLGKRMIKLVRYVREPILIAFSTASSEAAYPKMLEQLDRFGVPRRIYSFVLPLGYSFNLDGSMMYATFATIFIAQAYGIDLPITTHGVHDLHVHLLAAIDHASFLEVHGFGLERFIADPLVISDGLALVPDRPGHGVELDWERLRKSEI